MEKGSKEGEMYKIMEAVEEKKPGGQKGTELSKQIEQENLEMCA